MRVRSLAVALAIVSCLAVASLGRAEDGASWDRTKKLAPQVGQKLEESGEESVTLTAQVFTSPTDGGGEYFDARNVPDVKQVDSHCHYKWVREVKAAAEGEATETHFHIADYKGPTDSPGDSDLLPNSGGGDFATKGTGASRVLSFLKTPSAFGDPTELGPFTKKWLKYKFETSYPELLKAVESMLPEGPIAPDQEWTPDLKKVSAACFSGIELSGSAEYHGSLKNVHEQDGIRVGTLDVSSMSSDLHLAKDPASGAAWRPDGNLEARAWFHLEGIVRVDGALSPDGATYWNQLSINIGYAGTTVPYEMKVKTQKGESREKHSVQTRLSKLWNISLEKKS
jgi:hypothetical protein